MMKIYFLQQVKSSIKSCESLQWCGNDTWFCEDYEMITFATVDRIFSMKFEAFMNEKYFT
jgi:hypothetical protein